MIRLTVPSNDGKVSPEAFALSTEDRKQTPPRLSVFGASRTTALQAWGIMGRKPKYTVVARVQAGRIRSIVPGSNCSSSLDVRWDRIESELPGADGHAGLTGLDVPSQSTQRKTYRLLLADAANERRKEFIGDKSDD